MRADLHSRIAQLRNLLPAHIAGLAYKRVDDVKRAGHAVALQGGQRVGERIFVAVVEGKRHRIGRAALAAQARLHRRHGHGSVALRLQPADFLLKLLRRDRKVVTHWVGIRVDRANVVIHQDRHRYRRARSGAGLRGRRIGRRWH